MYRKLARACVGLVVAGLVSASFIVTAGASARSQQQGITDDEIQVVALVADLDGLRARGLIQQPKLTTSNLLKRWQAYADALEDQPQLGEVFRADIVAVFDRDPATDRFIEPVLYYKGFHAIQTHRLAHWLLSQGRKDIASYLQSPPPAGV